MQRPFFSLAILLEIIAVSLFFISSAYSQTGVQAIDAAAGAAHGCGWLWHGDSASEVRRNFVEAYEAFQSRSYVMRSNVNIERYAAVPWSSAEDFVVNTHQLVSTG